MSRDKKLGIGLAALSLLIAIFAGTYLVLAGGTIPLTAFVWPAVGFIIGLAILFFGFVEVGLQLEDDIEQFPQLVEDDLEQLSSGTITPTHIMVFVTLAAALIEFGLLLWFEKIYVSWGPFNVLLIALLVVGFTLIWSFRKRWFQVRESRLSPRIFWIPAAGWMICILIGAFFAEPSEYGGRSELERTQSINVEGKPGSAQPRNSYVFLRTVDTAGDALLSFDCDDEACLVVLLVAVVALAIFASATIPHFWVVATMLLLTLMAVIALRELLYRDKVTWISHSQ